MYTYIHVHVSRDVPPKTIVDDWWKISLGRDCRSKNLINMHTYLYIKQYQQVNQINYPNIPYPKVPPHFSPSLSASLSTGCGSVSELEFGPMVRRRYIDSQLHKEVPYPDRHRHRQIDKTEVLLYIVGCPHTDWLTNWLTVHTPPPACFFTPQDVLFVWRTLHVVSIHIYT